MKKKFSRQTRLFKYMLQEKEYRPSHYYSEVLSVSSKTLYNDINQLNKEMAPFDLVIEKKPRFGLLLSGSDKDKKSFEQHLNSMQDKKSSIFTTEDRQVDLLCSLMRSKDGLSLEELEEKYYISDSTLRADFEQIKSRISKNESLIIRKKGRMMLCGKESSIQHAVKNYLMETIPAPSLELEKNSKFTMFFFAEEIGFAKQSLKYILSLSNAQISDYYLNSLFFSFLVFGIRIKNGFHNHQNAIKKDDLSILETYFISHEVADFYEKNYSLVLTKEDIQLVNEYLYANGIHLMITPENIDSGVEKAVENMLNNLSSLLKVDLSGDIELKRALMAHIPPMVFRLKRNIRIENPLLSEIKKQYLLLFSLLWYVVSDLEERFDIRLNDDEISFLLIYFQVSLEKRYGVYFKKIIIVCPIGLSTSELLFTKIRGIIPVRDQILTKTADELKTTDLSDVDFIISTVSLALENIPVVYVSPVLTGTDIAKIMDEYTNQDNKYKYMTLASKSTLHQNIDSFIDEDYVFCRKNFRSKQECLDFLIDIYEKKNLVSTKFRQSVYDREEMGDTSIYTGVGIPHAAPETVYETKISFVTLKKPIKWGANDVSAVVLLAVSNKDIDLAREIIRKIFTIAEDESAVRAIRDSGNSIQLMSVIFNDLFNIAK